MSEGADGDGAAFVLDLLAGRCRAQALSTAATLGLADRLAGGPKSAAELAAELGGEARPLERLLELLSSLGVCEPAGDGRFGLTARGAALRGDALGPLAAFLGSSVVWDPWSRLAEALRAGNGTAFERTHRRTLYAHLARDPQTARAYDAAIEAYTRDEIAALGERREFAAARRVVDVGGGRGASLAALLRRWPALRGVLVDLPHVSGPARARLAEELPGRVEVVEGDYFEELPAGADLYLLKHVLHNWDDERAVALLRRVREALAPGGAALVIEAVLAPVDSADSARLLDLEMLVLTGGRERRKPEWRRLFHAAGLRVERFDPLTPSSWLLVGRPRP